MIFPFLSPFLAVNCVLACLQEQFANSLWKVLILAPFLF